jgi:ribosome-associated protein
MGEDLIFFMNVYDTVAFGLGAMQAIIDPKMSRKPKKGYYVRGEFVAEGSELDLAYKRELKGTDSASKTDLKRESTERQKLGVELLELRGDLQQKLLDQGHLSSTLVEALAHAKKITDFEGKRRQMQYVGKLMRKLSEEDIERIKESLLVQHGGSAAETKALHEAEMWRERLIHDEGAFAQWMELFPKTDAQQLRALIRQARKDAVPVGKREVSEGLAPRQSRAYREIFQWIRASMNTQLKTQAELSQEPSEDPDQHGLDSDLDVDVEHLPSARPSF